MGEVNSVRAFIDLCNANSGFISFVLSVITLLISILAIGVSIRAAVLPYEQALQINTAILEDDDDKPEVHIELINMGYFPIYLSSIILSQKIMHPLGLGFWEDELTMEEKILTPQVPRHFVVPMQNYDPKKYEHEKFWIHVEIATTNKTYHRKIGWTRG